MNFFKSLEKRRALTAVVVLLAAFASGYIMQNFLVDQAPVALRNNAPDAAPAIRSIEEPKPLPTPPAATLVPSLFVPPVMPQRTIERRAEDGRQAGVVNCDPRLFAAPSPAAVIQLTLHAPCHGNQTVKITQGPLTATQKTNENGVLTVRMPALEADVAIYVRLADRSILTELTVPDADRYQHIALTWDGPQMLRLNAFEFGAGRNEMGHVWSGAPKSPNRASRGSGGFLTRLATRNGPSAEIYSLPAGRSPVRGVVRLVVEAEVTEQSCGRVVKATAIQPTAFRRFSETDVEVALPDCDRVGEVVLLQNLLRDVRLAGR